MIIYMDMLDMQSIIIFEYILFSFRFFIQVTNKIQTHHVLTLGLPVSAK